MVLAMVSVPVCCPAVVGANAMSAVQLAPAARVAEHVLSSTPNPLDALNARSVSATVPELSTVTVCEELTLPTPVPEKFNIAGLICTDPAAPPVPASTSVAAFANFDVPMVNEPVATPFTVGAKTIPAVQLAPDARLAPHVPCTRLNGAVTDSESPLAATLFVFVIVAVCTALADPRTVSVKLIWVGFTTMPDAFCPTPFSGTCTAATPSVDELTISVAAFDPAKPGVKMTCTVQILLLFSVAPHVVVPVAKPAAA
jgi:hypothetical protein